MRRNLGFCLPIALFIGALVMPTPVFASSEGTCDGTWGSDVNAATWATGKNSPSGTFYRHVKGWATVRPLYPCHTGNGHDGWAFAIPVNVKQQSSSLLWQLGYYCTTSGDTCSAGGTPFFFWTDESGSGAEHLISSPRPSLGHRYRFEITRESGGRIQYNIYDGVSPFALLWSRTTTKTWPLINNYFAMWEVHNAQSMPGFVSGNATSDVVDKEIHCNSSWGSCTALTQWSSLTPGCGEPDGDRNNGTSITLGSAIFNVKTSSLVQPTDGSPTGC